MAEERLTKVLALLRSRFLAAVMIPARSKATRDSIKVMPRFCFNIFNMATSL